MSSFLGSQVSTLEAQAAPGSDSSTGVGATGESSQQPDSSDKQAAPSEAPTYQAVHQQAPSGAPAQHQHAQSAHIRQKSPFREPGHPSLVLSLRVCPQSLFEARCLEDVSRSCLSNGHPTMAGGQTHKDRIENLENMANTMDEKFSWLERTLQNLTILVEQQQAPRRSSSRSSSHRRRSVASASHKSESGSDGEFKTDARGGNWNPTSTNRPAFKPRLQFPTFSGEDPISWLNRANLFFKSQDMSSKEKVEYAAYYLEGEASHWWQWLSCTYDNQGRGIRWKDFEMEVRTRFGPTGFVDYDEVLSKMRQTGSLRDYQREFERVATQVEDWPEKALIEAFIGGLFPDIAAEVKLHRPTTMRQAIEIARLKDDQLRATRKAMAYKGPAMAGSSSGAPKPKPPLAPQPATSKRIPPGVKRLSWDEMQKRREQGLCFNCNEKFTPGYKCKVAQSFLIEVEEPPEEEEYEESDPQMPYDMPAANSGVEAEDLPEVSLHALVGSTGPHTMRVTEMLKGKVASLLIDNGSTHNFISTKVAHKLQILTTIIEPFEVVDIVLGVQWLAQLGKVIFDYKQMAMEFTLGGRQVRLSMQQGTPRAVEVNVVQKLIRAGSECYAIQIASQPRASDSFQSTDVPQLPTDVQVVLAKFPTVVQEPTNLPPSRPFDHRIPLLDEQPINVAPYRYAHHQKEEIEKQVKEMLQKNLIRPSTSPFSSPVLLVKKKDGTWRFCTDYRALNKATVKDRFSIPAIDDMLDELAGSTIFTKLDLRAGYHQIRMHSGDIHKTAFRTHHGHYEYMVMPFGLCNAPSTFQAAMNHIFQHMLRKFVLVFFDDILVYSKTRDQHLQHLEQVLSILARESFYIKLSKCAFG
ncbi:uncharacterized protein LOC127808510 [Diospyros lotus]|uniref:uncharacterized protein LOC127808510 n=1 Tax=Diospyros lotus TaxID=55363 RepID=UPI002259BEE8|nr:uncharacterized protein LOC127808510 [Diospyros lotus]